MSLLLLIRNHEEEAAVAEPGVCTFTYDVTVGATYAPDSDYTYAPDEAYTYDPCADDD